MLVVGVVHGAREAEVARALAAALEREAVTLVALGDRDADALHPLPGRASPVTAARHVGQAIAPGDLVEAARGAVAAVAGGLLAPLTPRYSVRNLALDLGVPLVLAVPAGPDAVNLVRLTAEAARGSGLTVAAAVLTGWPDQPDRTALDEQRLLSETVPFPVHTLGRDADARSWELRTDGPSPGSHAEDGGTVPAVSLDPYEAWEAVAVGDPRSAPRPRIMDVMLQIVAAEGPMRATRAYALYNRASGGKKLTSIARAPLSSAIYWLAQERKVLLTKRDEIPWQDDDLVRLPDTPAVRVRELGPRTLEEVPLDEIAELMRRLQATGVRGEAALKRAVLSTYGLVRLTAKADEYLGLAYGLLGAGED